ncbi:hypothetical protein K1T71_011403 [Dendrolimus kikuchii]|uniref:Uncharacterized protein n=1 Tax=Dendrolimus kikuchii TaxID=765133 RepID=A0ACC1CP31_9NEOP|nr:hypothetical protein K1T71_011403 [Dendrolimus kikuchii]
MYRISSLHSFILTIRKTNENHTFSKLNLDLSSLKLKLFNDIKTSQIQMYCCPRCEILYCSLDCYKSEKHIGCSEDFYRDCVNEELSSLNVDNKSKNKMIDILKRMQNTNSDSDFDKLFDDVNDNEYDNGGNEEPVDSDDEEGLELHERVKDLNLDDADEVWNVLNEDERNEFMAMINQGDVGSVMPQWEPWWMYSKKKKLVEDVEEIDLGAEELTKCPALKIAPKLSSLTTVQPSPAIKSNITNLLASYVFVMRYFSGEIDPIEGAIYLLSICASLESNANFDDPATAVESVAQRCLQSDLMETDQVSLDVMKYDTFLILQGPSEDNETYYCKAALSHTHQILSDAKLMEKQRNDTKSAENCGENAKKDGKVFSKKFPEHARDHLPDLDMGKVKKCLKKIEYYLSFVESFGLAFE